VSTGEDETPVPYVVFVRRAPNRWARVDEVTWMAARENGAKAIERDARAKRERISVSWLDVWAVLMFSGERPENAVKRGVRLLKESNERLQKGRKA
jgi:hypothetical protein